MMMWTKNAVSLSRDGEGSNVHDIRGAGLRSRDDDVAGLARGDSAPRTAQQLVHVQEGTPEQIAYKLFLHIVEQEDPFAKPAAHHLERRQYILSTYAQCVRAVRTGNAD